MTAQRRRSVAFVTGVTLAALLLAGGFAALGIWQLHRLAWKHDLIAQVEARIHAAPATAPRAATEPDAYRRVQATGRYLNEKAVLVQASTIKGTGYWVMTPLVTKLGFTLLVNRGFVPPEAKALYARPDGVVTVIGLLRITEPNGGFLRTNNPAANRWYSRDVAAIATTAGIEGPVAPYFIDAQASGTGYPIGGLTVVRFPDNHLAYAITWFALAAMSIAAYSIVMKQDRTAPRP